MLALYGVEEDYDLSPSRSDPVAISHAPTRIEVSGSRLLTGREGMEEIIVWSKVHGAYAMVVDKSIYTLLVYKNGVLHSRYPVELGPDPVSVKERQGDECTPEGLYQITWRRDVGHSDFYRAFHLDYPNQEDRRLGRTGGAIEIYGNGSGLRPGEGGFNWTAGCIALSDQAMDSLFALCDGADRVGQGTRVALVYAGSLPDTAYHVMEDRDIQE